jgi:vacuolar-type H+-ATPase subunit F/Vma7
LYRVLAIGNQDFCAGFALAGVETCCATGTDAAQALADTRSSGHYGIVIVDETLSAELDLSPQGADIPVVVAVPGDMHWRDVEQVGEDTYIKTLVRQAVGYQLDINV